MPKNKGSTQLNCNKMTSRTTWIGTSI